MAIQLGELLTNTKGGKSVPLRGEGSGPPVWQSAEAQKIIWQPAAFNDPEAKRVPVCLEPEETAVAQLQEIERQVVELLSQQSFRDSKIFGKGLVPKFKLNWDRVRIWDASGQPLPDPGDLASRSCKLKVELRQCWLMPPSWGILQ